MSWNFRLIEFGEGDEKYVAMHEVHYDLPNGTPHSFGAAAWLGGEDVASVKALHEMMAGAFDKPVLKRSYFK